MRKILFSSIAASVIAFGCGSAASAAPAGNPSNAMSSDSLLLQIKKGGGKRPHHMGGGYHGPRHGWRRWPRGRACPPGFRFVCVPGGCYCVPY
jgi:hypothetical protein